MLLRRSRALFQPAARRALATAADSGFSAEKFSAPALPANLEVHELPLALATEESLAGFGLLVQSRDEFTVARGNFEIETWPLSGWRKMDDGCGDEAGTVEGEFAVEWKGDFFYGHNLAIAIASNYYLDGLARAPEDARHERSDEELAAVDAIYLWMSDYHPDGAQLFWPESPIPFVVNLGPASCGDDVKPEDMRAFYVPAGKGVYLHPGTWHNGVYCLPEHCGAAGGTARFLTRQGRVHARVSASWAEEFGCLLKVPLRL